MLGLGFGLIGAGRDDPARSELRARRCSTAGAAAFGVLMTALGLRRRVSAWSRCCGSRSRLPRITVFCFAVIGTGGFLVLAASFSALAPAALMIGGVGACAGTTYVTGFTVLQESVSDELRGRTFATLYTVVRLCLLISLTISPLWADFWDWVTEQPAHRPDGVHRPVQYALPGVRIALWGGGIITLVAGLVAWRSIRKAERTAAESGEAVPSEHGPIEPIRPLGLVEPSPVAEPIEPTPTTPDDEADADRR